MSKMKRARALFEGSRLYRQAEEGSAFLSSHFKDESHPFRTTIDRLTPTHGTLVFSGVADCTAAIERTRTLVGEASRFVSPYIAIPTLVQAATEYYASDEKSRPEWLGTALKVSLALIWSNVHYSEAEETRAQGALLDIVKLACALEQLEFLKAVFENYGEGRVELRGDGLYCFDDRLHHAVLELKATYRPRGKVFRTLPDTLRAIHQRPDLALDAILNILSGDAPRNQRVFADSLFGNLTRDEPLTFWAGLWTRLLLFSMACYARANVTLAPYGVSILQTIALEYPSIGDPALLQQSMTDLFWTREWYASRAQALGSSVEMSGFLLQRPILRVARDTDLFVTSPLIISESINWFVEECVMRYAGRGGVPLSEATFADLVSAPFERAICQLFRRHCFMAGQVTEAGSWMIDRGALGASELLGDKGFMAGCKLTHLQGEKCPGEIDVLAYHALKEHLVVAECKVLGFPFELKRITNIAQKLGTADGEGFHAKLRKKIAWITKTDVFSVLPVKKVSGLIALDRMLPGMRGGEFIVTDAARLDRAIGNLYDPI